MCEMKRKRVAKQAAPESANVLKMKEGSMKRLLFFLPILFLLAFLSSSHAQLAGVIGSSGGGAAGAATPGLVQRVSVNMVYMPTKYTSIKIPLPNPTLANNCLIVRVLFDYTNVTVAVSDDKSNTKWAAAKNVPDSSNGVQQSAWVCPGIAAGTQYITFTFGGSVAATAYFSCDIDEWCGIVTSSAVDNAQGNISNGTAPATTTNVSPTQTGDLIWMGIAQDSLSAPGAGCTFNAGSHSNITWALQPLSTNSTDGCAVQAGQYSVTTAFKPAFGTCTSANWLVCAVALKTATAGTARPAGIRIVAIAHYDLTGLSSGTTLKTVTSGNLQAALITSGTAITGITSTRGSWSNWQSASGTSGGGYAVLTDSVNQSAGSQTLTVSFTAGGNTDVMLLDIIGAATSPRDNGSVLNNQNQTTGTYFTGLTVTPVSTPGIALTANSVNVGTLENAYAGPGWAVNGYGQPLPADTPLDQNNGFGVAAYSTTSGITFTWNESAQVGTWCGVIGTYHQ